MYDDPYWYNLECNLLLRLLSKYMSYLNQHVLNKSIIFNYREHIYKILWKNNKILSNLFIKFFKEQLNALFLSH